MGTGAVIQRHGSSLGIGPDSSRIQLIDKNTPGVVRTIEVGANSHFPEYTARGDRLVVYDARTFDRVETVRTEVPAGVSPRVRAPRVGWTCGVGLDAALRHRHGRSAQPRGRRGRCR